MRAAAPSGRTAPLVATCSIASVRHLRAGRGLERVDEGIAEVVGVEPGRVGGQEDERVVGRDRGAGVEQGRERIRRAPSACRAARGRTSAGRGRSRRSGGRAAPRARRSPARRRRSSGSGDRRARTARRCGVPTRRRAATRRRGSPARPPAARARRRGAGRREQVEDARVPGGRRARRAATARTRACSGKQPDLAGLGRPELEGQTVERDRPGRDRRPGPARSAVEAEVGGRPLLVRQSRRPERRTAPADRRGGPRTGRDAGRRRRPRARWAGRSSSIDCMRCIIVPEEPNCFGRRIARHETPSANPREPRSRDHPCRARRRGLHARRLGLVRGTRPYRRQRRPPPRRAPLRRTRARATRARAATDPSRSWAAGRSAGRPLSSRRASATIPAAIAPRRPAAEPRARTGTPRIQLGPSNRTNESTRVRFRRSRACSQAQRGRNRRAASSAG